MITVSKISLFKPYLIKQIIIRNFIVLVGGKPGLGDIPRVGLPALRG